MAGPEAGFKLEAGNSRQLAVGAHVVNNDQVHSQVTDNQPLVGGQVGVVDVWRFLFGFGAGLTLVSYDVGPGEAAISSDLEYFDVGGVVIGTVQQVSLFVEADVSRGRPFFHKGAQRVSLVTVEVIGCHAGLVAILFNGVDPLVRADLQVGWLLRRDSELYIGQLAIV